MSALAQDQNRATMSHPIVAVCTRCGREFHTASGPLGGLCDVPTCRGLVHWIDRTRAA